MAVFKTVFLRKPVYLFLQTKFNLIICKKKIGAKKREAAGGGRRTMSRLLQERWQFDSNSPTPALHLLGDFSGLVGCREFFLTALSDFLYWSQIKWADKAIYIF